MEQACCPFLTFRIDVAAGGQIRLKLTGPEAAQQIIQELISSHQPFPNNSPLMDR